MHLSMSQKVHRNHRKIHHRFGFRIPVANTLTVVGILVCLSSCLNETAHIRTDNGTIEMGQDEFLQLLGEAYVFGYPLVLMDATKRVITNVESPHPTKARAPVNQFGHYREFPDHTLTAVVKPNVDTYYSIAWLDLKDEPLVLSVPATDRYYMLPILDAYSNVVASPGTRTTGRLAKDFLITGPGWSGTLPDNMTEINVPTQMAWILGRVQVNDPEDGVSTVRLIQDGLRLVPLSQKDNPGYSAPSGRVDEEWENRVPVNAVRQMDIASFFNKMLELMTDNPPADADSTIVANMAALGLVPGKPFDIETDHFILRKKMNALPGYIHKQFEKRRAKPEASLLENGWVIVRDGIGTYDADYLRRAYIGFIALGANAPEDAIYPNCTIDVNGDPLDARKRYRIRFEPDQIPPVHAFWSITAYNADEFLIKNKINRYALGDRDELTYRDDGSLEVFIQSTATDDIRESNWLPISKTGNFSLTLRLFWPKTEVLDGSWTIPPVIPVE